MDFRMGFTISVIKNIIGILIEISLNPYFALGSIDTFKRMFWLCWVFVLALRLFIAVHRLFLAAANRGCSLIVERLLAWLLLPVASLVASTGTLERRLTSCDTWA